MDGFVGCCVVFLDISWCCVSVPCCLLLTTLGRIGEEKVTVLQLMRKMIAYQYEEEPLMIRCLFHTSSRSYP